ncbi:hypothetical protein AVEN_151625-1 [Araneus ventricosus]|uniref:Uncharacterized protein n=1 Tax=Araneus ventricosus TaxID=182803 RepID=A0A4Y2L4A8_ARAVE|nr:hypothetical protein AVEN_151625-1 [Araneus ventricosus]
MVKTLPPALKPNLSYLITLPFVLGDSPLQRRRLAGTHCSRFILPLELMVKAEEFGEYNLRIVDLRFSVIVYEIGLDCSKWPYANFGIQSWNLKITGLRDLKITMTMGRSAFRIGEQIKVRRDAVRNARSESNRDAFEMETARESESRLLA